MKLISVQTSKVLNQIDGVGIVGRACPSWGEGVDLLLMPFGVKRGKQGLIFQKQINFTIIYFLHKKSPMQSSNSQYPLFSYFLLPSYSPYYTFLPLSPSPSQSIQTNDFHSNQFYFSSQMDPQFLAKEGVSVVNDQSKNVRQNGELSEHSNQTNIEGMQCEKKEKSSYCPIILSYNPEGMCQQREGKAKKGRCRQRKGQEDKEYNPQAERKRKSQVTYQQNQNRNIIPNEINQIFSFLQKKNKSGHLVEKLLSKFEHPTNYSSKRYYLYQSLLKNKLGHYTNQNSLKLVTELYEPKCESWSEHEQRFYNKISRVLIRHFLHQDSIFMILTSKRMKSSKKSDHIRARHQVKESVLKILRGY